MLSGVRGQNGQTERQQGLQNSISVHTQHSCPWISACEHAHMHATGHLVRQPTLVAGECIGLLRTETHRNTLRYS